MLHFSAMGLICVTVGAVAVMWRAVIGLQPHSGRGVAPMYGDFEAQRHWMELTSNLPPATWYTNSTDNDLMYWGLDYPPLTAWTSALWGQVARILRPEMVALRVSRGIETPSVITFMRVSVLVTDILIFIPSMLLCLVGIGELLPVATPTPNTSPPSLNRVARATPTAALFIPLCIALCQPGLLLIDHGHFQYNGFSLGLTAACLVALHRRRSLLACMAFTLALNYKQMSLYHSVPIFLYLLSHTWHTAASPLSALTAYISYAGTVLLTTAALWLPLCITGWGNGQGTALPTIASWPVCQDTLHAVVSRLFPFTRGLFEDKVANLWCTLNPILRWRTTHTHPIAIPAATAVTLLLLVPLGLPLLRRRPTIRSLVLAMTASALAFFLASYQVHEKSVLLAALPASLLIHRYPAQVTWFLIVSTQSMYPLFCKDGLVLAYAVTLILHLLILLVWLDKANRSQPWSWAMVATVLVYPALHIIEAVVPPPSRLPDLHPVVLSAYSCGLFCISYVAAVVALYRDTALPAQGTTDKQKVA